MKKKQEKEFILGKEPIETGIVSSKYSAKVFPMFNKNNKSKSQGEGEKGKLHHYCPTCERIEKTHWNTKEVEKMLARQKEEMIEELVEMILYEFNPDYFQGVYDSIKVVLETKTDEETNKAIQQIRK